ncbi:hypothetical protein [Luteolibacter soli]|uniref:Uncharacterized protein n=1 Tax=Luteolibacter soli TaxID=3135280 RepID=A0ABU9B0J2_9BACT
MKKYVVILIAAVVAVVLVCMSVSTTAPDPRNQELSSGAGRFPWNVPKKISFKPIAGVYSSEEIKMKVTLTEDGDLIFAESEPWVELGRKKYVLENPSLSFDIENGAYYIDFLDPDPEVMTLSRRLKPFVQPQIREYLHLRRSADVAK